MTYFIAQHWWQCLVLYFVLNMIVTIWLFKDGQEHDGTPVTVSSLVVGFFIAAFAVLAVIPFAAMTWVIERTSKRKVKL